MKIELRPGERVIGSWTLLYRPPYGGKYNGKLTVTDRRLLYDARFDVSFRGLVEEALFVKWGSEGTLEIDKADISKVEVHKSFLSKKALVTLTDGSVHIFDYGALNIDKAADAIRAR